LNKSSSLFIETLKNNKNILVYIKGSPDPDAIASAFAIKIICKKLDINAEIIAQGKLSLPQNIEFVKSLKIPVKFSQKIQDNDLNKYDSYAVVDHQSAAVKEIQDKLPCSLHIDHHEIIEEDIEARFRIIDRDVGSTSTILTLLLMNLDLDFDESEISAITTALMYGIQTDTDKYAHATKNDYKALGYLLKYSNSAIINKIRDIPLSEEMLLLLNNAIENHIIYRDWLITGVGFLNETERDSIAIIADFLLKREDSSTVAVFAAIEKQNGKLSLDASFRTEKDNINLNDIIKKITPNGGARKYKGAYQINLDYFFNCPDKQLLWDTLEASTIQTIKNQRDNLYRTEIQGAYKNIRSRIRHIFGKH